MLANTFQHYLVGLLAIANNISAIPLFLSLVTGLSAAQVLKVTTVASTSAFIIMVISMLLGSKVLAFFGISMSAFQIAGGILLGATGMSMLNAKNNEQVAGKSVDVSTNESPELAESRMSAIISQAIVPISMPLTAGAGTISTVTLFSHTAEKSGTMIELFLAICAMSIIVFLIFHYAIRLIKILGQTGMNVMVKVMGLFTLAIGVQFIVAGVSTIYTGLAQH